MEERSFYRAEKKVDKVCVSIWLLRFFIVNIKCSTKEGVGGLETTLFTGCESLVPDLRGGCISFFPSWPLRSLRRGFFYAKSFSPFFSSLELKDSVCHDCLSRNPRFYCVSRFLLPILAKISFNMEDHAEICSAWYGTYVQVHLKTARSSSLGLTNP